MALTKTQQAAADLAAMTARAEALEAGLRAIKTYVTSSKFNEDHSVNCTDITSRIDEALGSANDAENEAIDMARTCQCGCIESNHVSQRYQGKTVHYCTGRECQAQNETGGYGCSTFMPLVLLGEVA